MGDNLRYGEAIRRQQALTEAFLLLSRLFQVEFAFQMTSDGLWKHVRLEQICMQGLLMP